MDKRDCLRMLGMSLVFMSAALIQGCGLKADPAPYRIQPLKPVTDVRLQQEEGGVLIRWMVQEQPRPMIRFKIYKSEFGSDGQRCPGCPPDEVLIADVAIGEAKMVRVELNIFAYRDGDIKHGRLYRYRVIGCDRTGSCSEPSVPATITMPAAP